jgi:hypothetical protein
MNFTTLWTLYANKSDPLDRAQRFLPMQSELTIYKSARLHINLDACVNTLRGECKEFFATHGRDGRNKTAQSRFPCYYDKVRFLTSLTCRHRRSSKTIPGSYLSFTT